MPPSRTTFVTACQQLLALGVVLAALTPAASVVSLDVVRELPTGSAGQNPLAADLSAYTRASARPSKVPTEAVDPTVDWRVQVHQAIHALFGSVHESPVVFVHSMRALRSLGEDGHALVREDLAAFVDLLQTLSDTPELRAAGIPAPSREASIVLVGGLRELIAISLEEGRDLGVVVDAATAVTLAVLDPR